MAAAHEHRQGGIFERTDRGWNQNVRGHKGRILTGNSRFTGFSGERQRRKPVALRSPKLGISARARRHSDAAGIAVATYGHARFTNRQLT